MFKHQPVLVDEVVELLSPAKGETYLDLTAGYGGHAQVVARKLAEADLSLIDADEQAVAYLRTKFRRAKIYHGDFYSRLLNFQGQGSFFDIIMADLGLSFPQLDQAERGFSFRKDGPLDMRFDRTKGLSLAARLDRTPQAALAQILKGYGEEPRAGAIAEAIKLERPQTTQALADLVARRKRGRRSKKHPATQVFQALRIWQNDELSQLEGLLAIAPELLKPAGRLAIITFHSLEDRLVKHRFKELGNQRDYESRYLQLTPKPVTPSPGEVTANPKSRSAKLRILEKQK